MSDSLNALKTWSPSTAEQNFGNDWLSNMHQVYLPDAIDAWPQGPVWWLFIVLVVSGGLVWLRQQLQRWQNNAYRRQGLQQLGKLKTGIINGDVKALRQLPELLRQVALVAWPRRQIVPLVGDAWLAFLSKHHSVKPPAVLAELAYLPDADLHNIDSQQAQDILDWCQQWITGHRTYHDHF